MNYKRISVFFSVFFALVLVSREYLIDYYYISSNSMLATLKKGNFVLVNKNYKKLSSNDIVVFNSVESNEVLIKRIIGLPNNTIELINTKTYINTKPITDLGNYVFEYSYTDTVNSGIGIVKLSNNEFEKTNYFDISKKVFDTKINSNNNWSKDNYGPLWIPQKDKSIYISIKNYYLYHKVILQYENNKLDSIDIINKNYVFKQNYYFMMGDNRHNSRDSRYFGFVPKDNIVGKMIYRLN